MVVLWRLLTCGRGAGLRIAFTVMTLAGFLVGAGAGVLAQEAEGTAEPAGEHQHATATSPEVLRELLLILGAATLMCLALLAISIYYAGQRMRRQLRRRPRAKSKELTDLWFENPIERGGGGPEEGADG